MAVFPDQEHVKQALQATRHALGLGRDASLKDGELSVFFKCLLIQGLKKPEIGTEGKASPERLRDCLESRLGKLLVALRLDCDAVRDSCFDRVQARGVLNFSSLLQQRLVDLALAAMLGESLAPEICLETEPWSINDVTATFTGDNAVDTAVHTGRESEARVRRYPEHREVNLDCPPWHLGSGTCRNDGHSLNSTGLLPGNRYHVVIFADAVFFQHEFYPLAVDAYVHGASLASMRTNMVAAHVDWLLEDGSPRRILFLDADRDRLREADLLRPIRPDTTQFHSLGRKEQDFHKHWSGALGCLQVNPYGASSLADDKAATLAGWVALGLEVPAFARLAVGDLQVAWQFVKAYREIVVKPNQSTEADNVAYFVVGQDNFAAAFAKHLECCWHQGDAMVQERRDGLVYSDSRSATRHNLVFRLNLAFDGNAYHVESGYVQLAKDTEQPAARSQGGRIVSPLEVLDGLCSRTDLDGPIVALEKPDWLRICDLAIRAASLFHGLLLVGLDVLLDLDAEGSIMPVFLEANPRPAGLCHSRLLDGFPDSCLVPNGVSLKLWEGLDRLCENNAGRDL